MGNHYIYVVDLFSRGEVFSVHTPAEEKKKIEEFLLKRFWTLRGFFHTNMWMREGTERVITLLWESQHLWRFRGSILCGRISALTGSTSHKGPTVLIICSIIHLFIFLICMFEACALPLTPPSHPWLPFIIHPSIHPGGAKKSGTHFKLPALYHHCLIKWKNMHGCLLIPKIN